MGRGSSGRSYKKKGKKVRIIPTELSNQTKLEKINLASGGDGRVRRSGETTHKQPEGKREDPAIINQRLLLSLHLCHLFGGLGGGLLRGGGGGPKPAGDKKDAKKKKKKKKKHITQVPRGGKKWGWELGTKFKTATCLAVRQIKGERGKKKKSNVAKCFGKK